MLLRRIHQVRLGREIMINSDERVCKNDRRIIHLMKNNDEQTTPTFKNQNPDLEVESLNINAQNSKPSQISAHPKAVSRVSPT